MLDALMPLVILQLSVGVILLLLNKRPIKFGLTLILYLILLLYALCISYLDDTHGNCLQMCRDQFKISIIPLMFYFLIENIGPFCKLKLLVLSVIISGIIISGIGIAEFFAGCNLIGELNTNNEAKNIENMYRTNGPFPEAIGYSTIVLLYIPFIYYSFKERIISKWLYVLVFFIFSAAMLVTVARASMIAYLLVMLVIVISNDVKVILANIFWSLVIVGSVYCFWGLITESLIFKERLADPGNIIGRWKQYKECLEIFSANPLIGIGYGAYKKSHLYYIHNSYLRYMVELGFIGFFLYMVFILSVILSGLKRVFTKGRYHLLKTRISLVLTVAVVANTIDILNNPYFTFILFSMISVLNLDKNDMKQCVFAV